jgi:DNA polymerase III subunit delta
MKLAKRPDIDNFLAKPPAPYMACLIYGKDRSLVQERGKRIALSLVPDPNDPFNVGWLNETSLEKNPETIEDELCAQSLLGGRRLVRIRFSGGDSEVDKLLAKTLQKHIDGAFNKDTFFLLEAGALGASSGLRKLADAGKSIASIACYEDEAGDIVRMAREALNENKLALSTEAMDIFVQRLPKERGIARQEIERLCLYIGPGSNKTLQVQELQDFLGVEPEASLFQAAFDAFGGRLKATQACLRRAFYEGENGIAALRALSAHVQKLRQIKALINQGLGGKEATKAVGIFWKQETEILRQAQAWQPSVMEIVPAEIIEADKRCKATGMPDMLIAERLYISISLRARRCGL